MKTRQLLLALLTLGFLSQIGQSTAASSNEPPYFFIEQPENQTVPSGGGVTFTAWARGTLPFSYQWLCNGTNLPGRTNASLGLRNVSAQMAGSYALVASNAWGCTTSRTATLTVTIPPVVPPVMGPGSLDSSFDPTQGGQWAGVVGWPGDIKTMALQANGKVFVAGEFASVQYKSRASIARLNLDASTDASFEQGSGVSGVVLASAMQADGKIIIAGSFTNVDGQPRRYLARLNSNGRLDDDYAPEVWGTSVAALALQPDGKLVIGGDFENVNWGWHRDLARLNQDGTLDEDFQPVTTHYQRVTGLALQPDGHILLMGSFTTNRPLMRLDTGGNFDTNFDWCVKSFLSNKVGFITALAVESSGKIYIGGGLPGPLTNYPNQLRAYRLNTNGTVDTTFQAPTNCPNGQSFAILPQPDGKVIFGGEFTNAGPYIQNGVVRFNADGRVDTTFDPGIALAARSRVNAAVLHPNGQLTLGGGFMVNGTNMQVIRLRTNGSPDLTYQAYVNDPGEIYSAASQTNGKILVAGRFTAIGSLPQEGLARFNPDGTPDATFRPRLNKAGSHIYASQLIIQPNVRILFVGTFDHIGSSWRPGLARVYENGNLDSEFAPGDSGVACIALQSDGKIVCGGRDSWGYAPRLFRLNANGSRDGTFSEPWFSPEDEENGGSIYDVAVQPDGGILFGGSFYSVNSSGPRGFARVYSNGSLDWGFSTGLGAPGTILAQPDGYILVGLYYRSDSLIRLYSYGGRDSQFWYAGDTNSSIYSIALQPDGKILIAGSFSEIAGEPRNCIARLSSDGRLDLNFDPGPGPGPQGPSASFPYRKVTLTGVAVAPGGSILVWGSFTSYNGTPINGIARLYGGDGIPPCIIFQPVDQIRDLGESAMFSVTATGTSLTYQWRLNGLAIANATNSILTVTNLARRNAGLYSVVVSNYLGADTSSNALLVVHVPQRLNPLVRLPDQLLKITSRDVDGGALLAQDLINFEVQASTDLANWTRLTNHLLLSNGSLWILDSSTNYSWRFYRVVEH